MKQTLLAILLLIGLSTLGQSGKSAAQKIEPTIKHDTVSHMIFIRTYYDTIKVEIAYIDKTYVRIAYGFQVRQIQTDSSQPNKGTIIGSSLYDNKWKPFTKILFSVNQIL